MKEFTFIKKIVDWFKALSTTQLAVGGAATALMVAGVIGGVALFDALNTSGSGMGTENTEATESLFLGNLFTETETTEEMEMTETTEATEVVEDINVRITTTSIERDLKIKIVDDDWDLVGGFDFVVTVTFQGESKEYNDHDQDGIIHIKDIEGGEYTVELHELEGIIISKNEITATVKGQIEYEKVEIENEIQDESQINVSVEDTANNAVVEEAPIVDTIPLLETTVTTTTVPLENVDLTNLSAAVVSQSLSTGQLEKTQLKEEDNSGDESEEEDTEQETLENNTGDSTNNGETGNESVSGQNSGSLESQGLSVGTTGETQTVTVATAKVSIPSSVTLYTFGTEKSTTATIPLVIVDENTEPVIQSYSWKIENENIATLTLADDQKSAKLTAKAEGTTKVVITFVYVSDVNGATNEYKLSCDVTVSKHTDNTTQLVDTAGNVLYVDSQAKKVATPADLGTVTEFYSSPKYTGWQSFDGYLYYYTAENVPATGEQIIGGVTYEFHEDGTLKESEQSTGIDVSKWQGEIDWKAVANAGIDFAIIRCGYRGSSTGVIVEDKYFKENIQGATENGIKVGVYFFTQAITEAEAVEEASTAIALVQGYKLHFPIFIDTEGSGGRADGLDKSTRTAIVKAFCETVRNSGYKPGIYASKYWYYDNLDESQLSTYNIWVAQYNTECNYRGRYDMWQYTSKGSVPGIKGNVDMNICYTKY